MEKSVETQRTLEQVLAQERALARQRRQAPGQPWAWVRQTSNAAGGQRTQLRLTVSGLVLLVALSLWLVMPYTVLAATFTVTKPADTNDGACNADCSLREAIIAANAAPGADVITLPAGTYTLSRSGVDNTAANGDLDVTGPLTINGAAQATTMIEAGASSSTAIDRVFSFNPRGTATGFAVALNNLTIRNGKNPNAFATQENDGGCFDFDGGTTGAGSLSVSNVTVSNCETTDGSGGGAAIFLSHGGTISFSGTTIQNNIASRGGTNFGDGGGLIFSCVQTGGTSTVTFSNSTISGNSTRSLGGNNSGSGGGIINFGACTPGTATANMQLHAVTISGNRTGADGGGIFSGGALTIDNVGGASVISNNSAGRSGGGIWLNHPNTTSTISKVTFSGNSAGDDGGAIRLGSSTPGNVLNVSFSRFINNSASSGKASGLSVYNGNATVTNNWWGCSTGPSAAPCDTAKLDPATGTTGPLGTGTLNFTPWLRVNVTAVTNPLVTGQSTGLTASILTDSNGGAVALSNLTLLLGQPVTWSGVGGTISGQQTTIQANGTATANYQATAAAAGNQAVAKMDNDGATGSNARSITVNKANTTATITAETPDPSIAGQAVTVNYNVTINAPGAGTLTGNVTVSDGVNSCTGALAAGSCTLGLVTAGARTLTATYNGDANFNVNTSAGVVHTVNKADTTITLTTHTPDPAVVGQAVTVNFVVAVSAPGAGTPTGNVTVSDGVNSCTGTVATGSCSLALTTVGAHTLTATYAGDASYNGSVSAGVAHTVNKANTTTTITAAAPNPSVTGQTVAVNFTVAASAPGAGTPTGSVTVSDGVNSCTATPTVGTCSLTFTTVGAYTLVATYSGDNNFNGSTAAGVTQTVTVPPTATPTPTPAPPTPTPSPTPTNVRTVAAWGYNATGASSVPTGLQAIAVAGGTYHSLALKVDGTVAAWGCTGTTFGQCNIPAGLSGVKAIGAGTGHSLAIKADGSVVAWGCASFTYGQCTPPVGLTGVISVAGGYVHSLALKSDGTVVAWGCAAGSWSAYGQCNVPTGLSGVKAIAAGAYHNLALKSDGTVVAWGRNTAGQINVPVGLNDVVAIAAGETHSLALKSNGTVVAWGSTTYGATTIPAGLTDVVAIGAGYYHSLALKRDGTVVAWGCVGGTNYNFGQCTIPAGLSGVTSISAGGAHNLVLTRIAPSGGGAGGAVVAADTGTGAPTVTVPLTIPVLGEDFLAITPSLSVSAPVAVEVAPVMTDSAPVSVPAGVTTPAVTTTQPVTTGDTGVTPVDANAPAAPDSSQQNQRLFLPIITNLASLAGAALGSPGGLALLAVVAVVLVVGLLRRRGTGR